MRLRGVSNFQWYLIQWLGKAHQIYIVLSSKMLHPSRIGFVVRRSFQLLSATVSGMFRALLKRDEHFEGIRE